MIGLIIIFAVIYLVFMKSSKSNYSWLYIIGILFLAYILLMSDVVKNIFGKMSSVSEFIPTIDLGGSNTSAKSAKTGGKLPTSSSSYSTLSY